MVNSILFPAYSASTTHSLGKLAEEVKKGLTDTKLRAVRVKTAPSTLKIGNSIFPSTGTTLAPRTISNIDDELVLLRLVHLKAKEFQASYNKVQKECSDELLKLSIFRPSTWKALFLETVDFILIALFQGFFSVGTHRIASFRAQEENETIQANLTDMRYVEVRALGKLHNIDNLKLLEAYWMLGDLDPEDLESQDKLASCLKDAGVYDLAAELFKSLLLKYKDRADLWQNYVDSLIQQGKHQEAEKEIAEIHKRFKRELKEKEFLCLAAKDASSDELINAFKKLQTDDQKIIKMMFEIECKRVLKDPSDNKFEELKQQLYFIQEAPTKLIRNMQSSEANADFWLELLVQCEKLNESKETKNLIVSKLQALDKQVLERSCAKIRSQEKTQAASNLEHTRLPDSLKAMLDDVSKHAEKQKTLLLQYRQAALSLLESEKPVSK